jgi:RNA polymerase sigma factor (sigma-70 family)
MRSTRTNEPALVTAAQAGDRRALDELVVVCLPLAYTIVRRALGEHPDVDDVVQEIMVRVLRKVHELREPEHFRAWLAAIAVHHVSTHLHREQAAARRTARIDEAVESADLNADFEGSTLLRLELSAQRRQVVRASQWLGPDDRMLLSLWWSEVAGQLTRAELAAALGVSVAHAGVRVQRMRDQLDLCRSVVAALRARPGCVGLGAVVADWDGLPSALWRKRIGQHTRSCTACARATDAMMPAERLLTGLALIPVPATLFAAVLGKSAFVATAAGAKAATISHTAGAGAFGGSGASDSAGLFGKLVRAIWAHPAIAATAVGALIAGGALTATNWPRPAPASPLAAPSTAPPATATETPPSSHFGLLPPGATLPSGAQCATAVRSVPSTENKGINTTANHTIGHTVPDSTGMIARVDGNFTGTTEQILRWTACKWGIDEDMLKAQAAIQSWWHMDNRSDWGTDASRCPAGHGPGVDGTPGQCPESYGLLLVRYPYNVNAFPGVDTSSAMNTDYAYAVWRSCYEGGMTWLNTVERGSDYAAGDAWGCMGVWYSGRWHTIIADGYITRVKDYLAQRIWETPNFQQP